jgi:F0F1-type ATP synthase assembly protein I
MTCSCVYGSAVVLLAQVALQFSANAITGQTASQDVVWSLYFPEDFQVREPRAC